MPVDFFEEIERLIPKFIWKYKRPRITKTTLKENKDGGLILATKKFTTKLIIIKMV